MRNPLSRRPSPAMVVALVALVSSLTGVAVGATLITGAEVKNGSIGTKDLANGGVTKKDLKRNSVRTKKVKDGSLIANDFAPGEFPGTGPQGPKGEQGEKGETGAQGEPASRFWARIASSGTMAVVLASSGDITPLHVGDGETDVTFPNPVDADDCAFAVTLDTGPAGLAWKDSSNSNGRTIRVRTADTGGSVANLNFDIAAFC